MENLELIQEIEAEIKNNQIVLYMKGTRAFPQCGFSAKVANILAKCGVEFKEVNVLANPNLRQALKDYSNWPTFPQLYIKGELIGGCDIVTEMFQNGELKQLLEA